MNKTAQCDRILRLLEVALLKHENWHTRDSWVPLPDILDLHIASYTRRIHELRKAGHVIEMHSEYVGPNQRRTKYRLKRASAEGTAA
jgi:Helix-turn-helix domain